MHAALKACEPGPKRPFGSRLPHRWPRLAAIQFVVVAGLFLTYELLRFFIARGAAARAIANAHDLIALEERLSLGWEAEFQALLLPHGWLMEPLNHFYINAHLGVTGALLIWLFVTRYYAFTRVRNYLLSVTALGFLLHWLYPLAPPRLVPGSGVVDTVSRGTWFDYEDPVFSAFVNEYAAMPSLHVGWALIVAVVLVGHLRSPWRHAAWLYPILMTIAVVATGNHFLLDAVAAAALLPLGLGFLELAYRVRFALPIPGRGRADKRDD